jgi:peptidoglycan/xylan/chitin deacetylase (PgdA/CDA1 family)
MAESSVLVLTYHSIGSEPGPTSIAPDLFRRQMDELKRAGYKSLDIQGFIDWRLGRKDDPARRVIITFDDAFADFEKLAFPILNERGLSSLMFVPTGKVGGEENWNGANDPPRPLMGWKQIKALARKGVEFGAHSITHADLTTLPADQRREEIEGSGAALSEQLGKRTRAFAAPYGRVNAAVISDIAKVYELAFGVRLDRARQSCDPVDVPRVDMHYFRDERRWRDFLEGGQAYFLGRRALRGVKHAVTGLVAKGARYG